MWQVQIGVTLAILSATLLAGGVVAIQVITEPAGKVTVAEGQRNVNLLCLVEEPIDFCM